MATWRKSLSVVALAGVVVSAAPQLKSSWRNPDPHALPVSRVIVIGFTSEQSTRRTMEDALTAEIRRNGASAEPSYSIVPGDVSKDPAAVKAKIAAAGVDGAVIVRVAGVSQEQSWDPGFVPVMPVYYQSLWSYYGYWQPYAWDAGYLRTDTVVRIEAVVYAVNGELMIWSGLSESTNPGSVPKLIQQVAVAVGTELKKRNVVR
ncbi:MAG: hypothetical protein NTY02_04130 [Acidobacteria bacterium]|nr:hypothetical protein [Acidobacteriota bacterium]